MGNATDSLIIREDFRAYLRPLTVQEQRLLESALLNDGCRDPLVVWPTEDGSVLVDGHTRYGLCQKHGLPFKTVEKEFADEEEVFAWLVAHANGRRNLTPEEKRYYLGLRYLREKGRHGGDRKSTPHSGELIDTCVVVAEEEGVGKNTVLRAAKFAEQLDKVADVVGQEFKWDVLGGKAKCPPKVCKALLEAEPEEAAAAVGAAKEEAEDGKPIKATAILDALTKERCVRSGVAEITDSVPTFNPAAVVGTFRDKIVKHAQTLTDAERRRLVFTVRTMLRDLEKQVGIDQE